MPASFGIREDHRWRLELPPLWLERHTPEGHPYFVDYNTHNVTWEDPRLRQYIHLYGDQNANKPISYVFVVGDHYMEFTFRNEELFSASAENDMSYLQTQVCLLKLLPQVYFYIYIANSQGIIVPKVRYIPILNSRGPDPYDLNEPFESIFTAQPNNWRGMGNRCYVENGSMPCPEHEMKVTVFDAQWTEATLCAGPKSVEHYAWILQSDADHPRTFVGRIGGSYMILQKNNEGEQFGIRYGQWQPGSETWKVFHSSGGVRGTPWDDGNNGYNRTWAGEETWRKFQNITGVGTDYCVKAHEHIGSEEARHLF